MSKDRFIDYSTTNASNSDIGGIGILGSNSPSNFDNAIREFMTHMAETIAGTHPVFDSWTWCDPVDTTKRFRFDGGNITAGQTRVVTMPDGNVTIPSGTLVTETAVQTLANKTFTSPAFDGVPTGLDASTTAKGLVELATDAETQAGTDTARAITPSNLTAKEASSANYRANTADRILTTDQVWGAAAEVTLVDAATITLDMSTFINAVVTLGGNRALGNPSNEKVGQTGFIRIVQDATGSRTLSYGTDWEFAGGAAPVLSTAASAEDLLFYQVLATDRVFGSLVKGIA